jgi:alpha-glucosidase
MDTTVVLQAEIADYIVIARRKADKWYIGAMTDWTPREFDISFSFLPGGNFNAVIMQDGMNADKNAVDYKKVTSGLTNKTSMRIKLAKGGGWAAMITP